MKIILLAGAAGAAGTLLRYFSVKAVNVFTPDSCWGTLTVNVLGAFLAGFLFVLCKNKLSAFQEYFPILCIEFLGHLQLSARLPLKVSDTFLKHNTANFFSTYFYRISVVSEPPQAVFCSEEYFSEIELPRGVL